MRQLHILSVIGMVLSIGMGIHFDNGWFFVWFLFSVALGNIAREIEEDRIWNNGICAKYNEPWEFECNELHTETSTSYYRCRDERFSASPRDHFRQTYRGK